MIFKNSTRQLLYFNRHLYLTITRNASRRELESVNLLNKLEKTFSNEGLKVESPFYFRNVSLVNPRVFSSFFYRNFKLKFVETDQTDDKKPGVELLRNIASNYDYWLIRNNHTHLLYYRIQILEQRINFLRTVGLNKKEKLNQIRKHPPVLVFTFTDCSYDSSMVYLRGLLPKDQPNEFIHMFHPLTSKLTVKKDAIRDRVKVIEDSLEIEHSTALREILDLPCFFMDPSMLSDIDHQFIHKNSMSFYFDIDKHTAPLFPPICNSKELGLSAKVHFSNKANNSLIKSLPTYHIKDILDTRYPTDNGKGSPECLSSFLLRAEKEEEKDRTGGQPLKGIRGFNHPKRQY